MASYVKTRHSINTAILHTRTVMMLARYLDLLCKGVMQADSERTAYNNGNAVCAP
jgi:hypothetical protein